jgi:hypothetical protein
LYIKCGYYGKTASRLEMKKEHNKNNQIQYTYMYGSINTYA